MQRRTFLMLSGSVVLLGTAQGAQNQKLSAVQSYPLPESPPKPTQGNRFSQVGQSRGVQVYSMGADHVGAVCFSGEIEWVGGPLGIKRVDRVSKRVRVYSTGDGLPVGEVLQVVAEGKEAYALLMRPSDGLLSFCALEPSTDRWRVLIERALETSSYPPVQKGFLALGTDWAAFVPERTTLQTERRAPFYLFHRRTQKLQAATWDSAIAADHRQLECSAALIQGSTLWLGSSIGVLGVPLNAISEPTRWQRFLPDRQIRSLVGLRMGTLAVLSVARSGADQLALQSLELASGKTASLPVPPSVSDNIRMALVGEGSTLWFLSAVDQRRGRENFGKPLAMRLLPKATQWEAVSAVQTAKGTTLPPGFPFPEALNVASETTLPDTVAGVLVCLLERGFMPDFVQPARMLQQPWLDQRFWRWRSPETRLPDSVASNVHAYGSAELADPLNPETIWLTEGDAFVCVPRAERPKWEVIPQAFSNGEPMKRRLPLTSPHAQRLPVDASHAREGIRVRKLLAGQMMMVFTDGNRSQMGFLLQPDGSVEPLKFTSKQNPQAPVILSSGVAAGRNQHCFLHYTFEQTLMRWDSDSKHFMDTGIAIQQSGHPIRGGTREGLWWPTNTQGQLLLQRITDEGVAAGKPEVVLPDDAPFGKGNTPELIGIVGEYLWFKGYTPQVGRPLVAAWSPASKTWSASTTASSSGNDLAVTAGGDGMLWLVMSGKELALSGYDPQENRWEQVPPPAPEKEGLLNPRILAADATRLWVATQTGLWCYQRKTRLWERSSQTLPRSLALGSFTGAIPASNGQWWVGSYYDLWRFDTATGAFTEATVPAGSGFIPLHLKAVTPTAVWGLKGSLLARLDRKAGKAALYGRESGVPESLSARLCEAGGTAWLVDQNAPIYPFGREPSPTTFPAPPSEGNGRQTSWVAVATDPGNPSRVILAARQLYRATPNQLNPTPLAQPDGERAIHDLLTLGSWVYVAASDGLWRFNTALKWERLSAYIFGELRQDTEQPDLLWALSGQGPGAFSSLMARVDPSQLASR